VTEKAEKDVFSDAFEQSFYGFEQSFPLFSAFPLFDAFA